MKKLKPMTAYLIDSKAKTVTEVKYSGDYNEIYKLCGFDTFTMQNWDDNDAVFVDDNGLLKITPETTFFMYRGAAQPLAGNGLVLGLNPHTGDSVSPRTPIANIRERITFYNLPQVQAIFR